MQHSDVTVKPQIWLADKDKRLKKSQFVDAIGDVGYGFGSVFSWKGDFG